MLPTYLCFIGLIIHHSNGQSMILAGKKVRVKEIVKRKVNKKQKINLCRFYGLVLCNGHLFELQVHIVSTSTSIARGHVLTPYEEATLITLSPWGHHVKFDITLLERQNIWSTPNKTIK